VDGGGEQVQRGGCIRAQSGATRQLSIHGVASSQQLFFDLTEPADFHDRLNVLNFHGEDRGVGKFG
jgi:hypothetical protein